tara:strand:- start:54 stop:539 length:486 start_codon:yes stop_codon:yes gene_type:complete
MIKELKLFLGIFLFLAASRFIPHPPNFTSLIALSFYVPAILGIRYLPFLILSFVLTDIFIGFHNTVLFTWGSVIIIGILSKYFIKSVLTRISGALAGALIFYIITNFGVWFGGMYEFNLEGLTQSYIMGLPFLGYSLISTFIFSSLVETFYKIAKLKFKNI